MVSSPAIGDAQAPLLLIGISSTDPSATPVVHANLARALWFWVLLAGDPGSAEPDCMSSEDLARQVRENASPGARAYYLWNDQGRFPSQGGLSLEPLSVPYGLPPGEYQIGYLNACSSKHPLPPRSSENLRPVLRVESPDGAALSLARHADDRRDARLARAPRGRDVDSLPAPSEFEATRRADEPITTKHLIGTQLQHLTELGEAFVYVRAHRQEFEQGMRMMYEMAERNLRLARMTVAHTQEVEALQADARRQNAPPADPVGSFFSTLNQLLPLLTVVLRAGHEDGETGLGALLGGSSNNTGSSEGLTALLAEVKKLKRQLAKKKTKSDGAAERPTKQAASKVKVRRGTKSEPAGKGREKAKSPEKRPTPRSAKKSR